MKRLLALITLQSQPHRQIREDRPGVSEEGEVVMTEGGQLAGSHEVEGGATDVGVRQAEEQMFLDKMTDAESKFCRLKGLHMSGYL